jgi:hypothetical protein
MLSDPQKDSQISNRLPPESGSSEPLVYQIRLSGHLGPDLMDWFEGMALRLEEGGDTVITGAVADQAALHGLLKKVRDLGIPLVSINPVRGEEQLPEQDE